MTKSKFVFWYTLPEWLAFSWFTTQKRVDWINLIARCKWIAQQSFNIVQKLSQHPSLSSLSIELSQRARHYDIFSQYFMNDLGLAEQKNEFLDSSDKILENIGPTYRNLQNLFNTLNRSRIFNVARSKDRDINVMIEQNIRKAENSTIVGVGVKNLTILRDDQVDLSRVKNIDFAQNVEYAKSLVCRGIEIQTIVGGALQFPLIASINGRQNISFSEKSSIEGFLVNEIVKGTAGFSINLSINVERFKESNLVGIVAKNYAIDAEKQGVHISSEQS